MRRIGQGRCGHLARRERNDLTKKEAMCPLLDKCEERARDL